MADKFSKKIKFALKTKSGKEIRTWGELCDNFDAEEIIANLKNFKEWLGDRYYDKEYSCVKDLLASMEGNKITDEEVALKICKEFGIPLKKDSMGKIENTGIKYKEETSRNKMHDRLINYMDAGFPLIYIKLHSAAVAGGTNRNENKGCDSPLFGIIFLGGRYPTKHGEVS